MIEFLLFKFYLLFGISKVKLVVVIVFCFSYWDRLFFFGFYEREIFVLIFLEIVIEVLLEIMEVCMRDILMCKWLD